MMMSNELYSIGQLAKICNISVQALRYYDNTDLLKPTVVKENGYRYYSSKQILYVNIIKALKELNFSLAGIKEILLKEDIDYLLSIFKEKSSELEKEIEHLVTARNKVKGFIDNLELYQTLQEGQYIELKNIPPRLVAFTRYRSPSNPESFMKRYNELHKIVRRHNWFVTGSLMAIFHDHYTEFDYENADIEVCTPVKKPSEMSERLREIPGGKYLSRLHQGPYDTTAGSYQYMLDWCQENGYQIEGAAIEIYLIDFATTRDPDKFLTELQLPVKKSS